VKCDDVDVNPSHLGLTTPATYFRDKTVQSLTCRGRDN